jgi:hypothetical protein
MTRITCTCEICLNNNGGQPLHALVPGTLPETLLKTKSGRHGLVYSANDPSIVDVAVRARTGIQAG